MQDLGSYIQLTNSAGFVSGNNPQKKPNSAYSQIAGVNPFVTAGAASENPGIPAVSKSMIHGRFRFVRYSVFPAGQPGTDIAPLPQGRDLFRRRKTELNGQPELNWN